MTIMNPRTGGGLTGLFRNRPATDERVATLRAVA